MKFLSFSILPFAYFAFFAVKLPLHAASAAPTTIRVGYPQLNGGQTPLWNIADGRIDQRYGLDIKPVYIPGEVRLTQSMLSRAVDIAMTGGAAVNAMLSGAELIYVGMPVATYAFSLYARAEIKDVTDLRGKVLGVITKGTSCCTSRARKTLSRRSIRESLKPRFTPRRPPIKTFGGDAF